MPELSWDEQREANIARNRAMLAELDINSQSILSSRAKPPPKPKQTKKRKAPTPDASGDSDTEASAPKAARTADGGLRRSSRVAGKVVDYAGDGDKLPNNRTPKYVSEAARKGSMKSEAKVALQRTQNPYVVWQSLCSDLMLTSLTGSGMGPFLVLKLGRGGNFGMFSVSFRRDPTLISLLEWLAAPTRFMREFRL